MDNLDTFTLAKLNILRKPFRSASLAFLTFALAFTLFTGSFLVKSLKEGLASLSNRLGADIIVVPQGYDSKIEGALLAIQQSPENSLAAVQLLDDLGVPKDMGLEDVSQLIKQFQIEKGALQEFFDDTLKHYTNYRDIKEHVRSREEKVDRSFEDEKTL